MSKQSDFKGRIPRRTFFVRLGGLAASSLIIPALDLKGALAAGPPALAAAAAGRPRVTPKGAPPAGLDVAGLKKTCAEAVAALEKRFPYATALYTRDEELTITVDRAGVSVDTTGPREGVVLSVYDGLGFREEAGAFITAEGIGKLRDRLLQTPAVGAGVASPDPGPALDKSWIEVGQTAVDSVSLAERVERARALHAELLKRQPNLMNARITLSTGVGERVFVNRARRLHQRLGRAGYTAFVLAPAAGGGRPGSYSARHRGVGGLELCAMPEAEIQRLLERAGRLAGAGAAPAGERVVITEPGLTGTLAHESFGHGVEVDLFVQGRARAAQYLGKPVGSSLVRIYDDPTQAGANGFYWFDDEGMSAASTTIVDQGIFKGGLTDALSAWRLKMPRTPNGRRESSGRKAYARMSSTFFGKGTSTPAELIAGVKDGLLVGALRAGIEDPKGWGIQVVAQYGEEIKDGRLTGKVYSPVTLSGYVPDVLGSVDGVGNDFELTPGTCGKGYKELVPVSTGGPHLRFKARVS